MQRWNNTDVCGVCVWRVVLLQWRLDKLVPYVLVVVVVVVGENGTH